MNNGWRMTLMAAGLVLTLAGRMSWAGPPNPTASDTGDNTAGGTNALVNTVPVMGTNAGVHNTAFGARALTTNTDGRDNSAFGTAALQSNTEGSINVAVGAAALFSNTAGS